MSRCLKCGNYYSGWDCPVCAQVDATNRQTEAIERAEKARAEQADEAARRLEEREDEQRRESEREREWREEQAAIEREIARDEAERRAAQMEEMTRRAVEEQRLIAQEEACERERIAATGWQLQAQAKVDRAAELLNAGLYSDAIALLADAMRQDPGNSMAHLEAGEAYLRLGASDQGVVELEKACVLTASQPSLGLDGLRHVADRLVVLCSAGLVGDVTRYDEILRVGAAAIVASECLRLLCLSGGAGKGALAALGSAGLHSTARGLVSELMAWATTSRLDGSLRGDSASIQYWLLMRVEELADKRASLEGYRHQLEKCAAGLSARHGLIPFSAQPPAFPGWPQDKAVSLWEFAQQLQKSGLKTELDSLLSRVVSRFSNAFRDQGESTAKFMEGDNRVILVVRHFREHGFVKESEQLREHWLAFLEEACAAKTARLRDRAAIAARPKDVMDLIRFRLEHALALSDEEWPKCQQAEVEGARSAASALDQSDRNSLLMGWSANCGLVEEQRRQALRLPFAEFLIAWEPAVIRELAAKATQTAVAIPQTTPPGIGQGIAIGGLVWFLTLLMSCFAHSGALRSAAQGASWMLGAGACAVWIAWRGQLRKREWQANYESAFNQLWRAYLEELGDLRATTASLRAARASD